MEQDYQNEGWQGMSCIQANSLRKLVDTVNDNGIMKEDIVQIIKDEETFFLLYYK